MTSENVGWGDLRMTRISERCIILVVVIIIIIMYRRAACNINVIIFRHVVVVVDTAIWIYIAF